MVIAERHLDSHVAGVVAVAAVYIAVWTADYDVQQELRKVSTLAAERDLFLLMEMSIADTHPAVFDMVFEMVELG